MDKVGVITSLDSRSKSIEESSTIGGVRGNGSSKLGSQMEYGASGLGRGQGPSVGSGEGLQHELSLSLGEGLGLILELRHWSGWWLEGEQGLELGQGLVVGLRNCS